MNNNTIGFRNRNQVVLFVSELKGQISDGMWENARPSRHYENPCNATAFVAHDETEVGRNFPSRAYNFSNPELVEIVGSRMLNQVKMGLAFPTLPIEDIFDIETTPTETLMGWVQYAGRGDNVGTYYSNKVICTCKTFGVGSVEELINLLESRMGAVNYTLTNLRKDLNDMKKCWRIVR